MVPKRCLFQESYITKISQQRNSKTALEISFHQKHFYRRGQQDRSLLKNVERGEWWQSIQRTPTGMLVTVNFSYSFKIYH